MDPKEEDKKEPQADPPSVDLTSLVAALHKAAIDATDPEVKAKCIAALKLLMPSDEEEAAPSSQNGGAAQAKVKAAMPAPRAAAAGLPPELAAVIGDLAKSVQGLEGRLDTREAAERQERAAAEASERSQLASLTWLAPPIAAAIKDPATPIKTARSLASVGATPGLTLASIGATSSVAGTQGKIERAIPELPEAQASVLRQQMGVQPPEAPRPHIDGMGQLVVPCETPSQVRARLAQKAAVSS